MKRPLMILIIIVMSAKLFFICTAPLVDTTEGRYAAIALEMERTNDWVTPRFWHNGEYVAFLGKPPLHFWLTAGAIRLFGVTDFSARLVAWLCAAGLIGFLHYVIRRFHGWRTADLAALYTLTAGGFVALAGVSCLDMTLTFWVAGALLAHYGLLRDSNSKLKNRWSLLVFAFLALAFLTKGPVGILSFGFPVFIWTLCHNRWRDLANYQWAVGLMLFLIITIPWFAICELKNPGFLKYFFWNENVLRFLTPAYGDRYGSGHSQFRGASVLMTMLVLMPWSVAVPWFLIKHRHRARVRVLVSHPYGSFFWIAPVSWSLLWVFGTQYLATYFIPLAPLGSIWIARLVRSIRFPQRWIVRNARIWVVLITIFCLAAGPVLERRSTRMVKGMVNTLVSKKDFRLIWVHKAPYSANYYYRNKALFTPVAWNWGNASQIATDPARDVYVMRSDDFEILPSMIRNRIIRRVNQKRWLVFQLSTANDARLLASAK